MHLYSLTRKQTRFGVEPRTGATENAIAWKWRTKSQPWNLQDHIDLDLIF